MNKINKNQQNGCATCSKKLLKISIYFYNSRNFRRSKHQKKWKHILARFCLNHMDFNILKLLQRNCSSISFIFEGQGPYGPTLAARIYIYKVARKDGVAGPQGGRRHNCRPLFRPPCRGVPPRTPQIPSLVMTCSEWFSEVLL